MVGVICPLYSSGCDRVNVSEYIFGGDEFELEFSSSSRAMKVPSRAELGHFNFRAETKLTKILGPN
jgi:hypothetical protein